MNTLVTVVFGVLFFAAVMACVALHEVGHLVPAKAFGVKVPKYFVGFGKTLWSTRRGETEYGVKLVPLGGFVQLLGMYPPGRPGGRDTRLGRLADEARAAEWEEITPADHGRLFYEKPVWQKIVMMAGGITMNLLIAFALFWGVAGLYGTYRTQPTVAAIVECLPVTPRTDGTCLPTDPRTPAAEAGLRAGDTVVEFNGVAITDYPQLSALIRDSRGGEVRLVVERDGVRTPLAPTHTLVTTVADPLDPGRTVQAGWLGVRPVIALTRSGPVEVLRDMRDLTGQSVVALVQLPVKTWNVAVDLVTGQPRDVTGPISVVGASTVAGEIAGADLTVADKAASFVSLLAGVNLFLAVFNLVPLPPLDGGHIVGAVYEGGRRSLARLRGKPDPGPADTAKMLPVAYVVGGLLLVMGVVLIVADIVSPVKIF
nr:PDZ domain-containing protein [Propionibacterium sp.]